MEIFENSLGVYLKRAAALALWERKCYTKNTKRGSRKRPTLRSLITYFTKPSATVNSWRLFSIPEDLVNETDKGNDKYTKLD